MLSNCLYLGLIALVLCGCTSTPQSQHGTKQSIQAAESPTAVAQAPSNVVTPDAVDDPEKTVTALPPQQAEDVWQRIRQQLEFPDSDHPIVTRRINWYLRHPNYMHAISERAAPFLFYLVNQVEKRQLPIEIALMPLIESDFDTRAYSPKHASGLWQLTPSIAKYFGVKINNWYDGRQDIVEATQASLDFIEYLFARFDGDWYHTIAAYNTGEGRVLNAIKRNKRANLPTDFFSLKLPKETRHFVPKLLAVTQILKQQLMEFPPIDNQPAITVMPLRQDAILPTDSPWREIDRLNPGYMRFPALIEGPEHIVIPHGRKNEWQQFVVALPEISATTWLQYRIRPGDTLSEIAAKYSVDVKQIKTFNKLKGNRITAGKTLFLPILADDEMDYTVKNGDSLWHIARRFGTTVTKLKQWNGLSSDVLKIGAKLKLFLNRT